MFPVTVPTDPLGKRVAKGLAHHSHAARCAELCGLPHGVVGRAEHVWLVRTFTQSYKYPRTNVCGSSALFAAHELEKLLDEDMSEEEARELEEAEAIGRKFLAWNLDDETAMDRPLKESATEILGMTNGDQE